MKSLKDLQPFEWLDDLGLPDWVEETIGKLAVVLLLGGGGSVLLTTVLLLCGNTDWRIPPGYMITGGILALAVGISLCTGRVWAFILALVFNVCGLGFIVFAFANTPDSDHVKSLLLLGGILAISALALIVLLARVMWVKLTRKP